VRDTHRLIASRFPPVGVITDKHDLAIAFLLESATKDRLSACTKIADFLFYPLRCRQQHRCRDCREIASRRLYATDGRLAERDQCHPYEKLNLNFIRDIAPVAGKRPLAPISHTTFAHWAAFVR